MVLLWYYGVMQQVLRLLVLTIRRACAEHIVLFKC